ncbi:transketolase [Achromobacter denitrificans]|uniref:transketolase n=1 Tax=Achromobacter denitrificans TaxID=32002 RepID=UPI0029A51621|nr:transketolase [Achromobacter sp.]
MPISEAEVRRAKKRLLQMHFESGVGHIGGNMSCLDALLLVQHEYLSEQDRFVLSKGHSAGALYIALWSLDRLSDDALKQFHKDDTLLAGHPPASGIGDIRFATGSLGHGLSLAAGTAKALKIKQQAGHVFCLTSDGEWQEGSTWEALTFAAHHQLDNLTVLVDHNGLQGFGRTADVASMSPLDEKIAGFNVDIQRVDGHKLDQMRSVLDRPADKCRVLILDTLKGRGVPFMEDRMEWHYLPLKKEQYVQALLDLES